MKIHLLLAVINWQTDPIAFRLGSVQVAWYGLLFALAFFVGNYFLITLFKNEGRSTELVDKFFTYVFVAIVVGARLGHCLFYDWSYYSQNPLKILMIWEGGLASHGGVLGLFIATYLFCKKYKEVKFLWLLDRLGLTVLLTAPFIRLGNFINSEIVGIATSQFWGVKFLNHLTTRPDLLVDGQVVARHPVQLYEALLYFLLFLFFYAFYHFNKNNPSGLLISLLLIFVFSGRFLLEFLKVRQASYALELSFSIGQWLSMPAVVVGICLLIYCLKKKVNN